MYLPLPGGLTLCTHPETMSVRLLRLSSPRYSCRWWMNGLKDKRVVWASSSCWGLGFAAWPAPLWTHLGTLLQQGCLAWHSTVGWSRGRNCSGSRRASHGAGIWWSGHVFILVALVLMISWVVWMAVRLFLILYLKHSLILDFLTSSISQPSLTSISVTRAFLWYSPATQWVAQQDCTLSSLLISSCVCLWCRCHIPGTILHLWAYQGLVLSYLFDLGGCGDSSSDKAKGSIGLCCNFL